MRMMLLALFPIAVADAAAQTPERFDLICTGTTTHLNKQTTPFSVRFSIDLAGQRYCAPKCDAPRTIALVEPDKITLRNDGPVGGSLSTRYDGWKTVIGRADGAFEQRFTMAAAKVSDTTSGTCTPAEFTPLPSTMF